jgi:hypothetical protein
MFKQIAKVGVVSLLVLLIGAFSMAFGQGSSGNIGGTVTDAKGAVVAGATVEATNQETGDKRTAVTADNGTYTIPNLTVGLYTVTTTATGFAASTVKDVKVSVAFTVPIDVALNPAGAAETVTVTAGDAATQLNTTDQQLSTIIEQRKIIDLPLLSRDPNALILLSPGTVASTSTLGGFSVNGQRERNNNFLVDGVDNNDADVPGIPGGIATPNIDATQEFRVITSNFNAEYGRNSGAIIAIATKNGTNEFHGNGYIYYRSDRFNARNFFNVDGAADPQQRRQFGASIGGPIKKDKAFFFFNYEGDRFDQGFTLTRTVPTAAARQGIFALGGTTGTINAGAASANNVYGLPIRPQIVAFLNSFYPLPNTGKGPLPGIFENFVFGSQTNDRSDSTASRVDWRVSEKHSFSATFNFNNGNFEFCCESFPGLDDSIKSPQKTFLFAVNLVSNITPNLVNEARAGLNRSELFFYGDAEGGTNGAFAQGFRSALTALGASFPANQFGNENAALVSGTYAGINAVVPFDTQFRFTGTTTFADSMTWIKENHTFKFGFEHRRVYTNGASDFGRSENINFNYPTTFGDPLLQDAGGTPLALTGNLGTVQNFASFLYGLTASQSQSQYFNKLGQRTEFDYRGFRVRELDFFFQDTWKVRPNFTLNYGLRYEFKGVPFEVNGQLSTLVDQDPSGFTPPGGFTFTLVGKNSGTNQKLYENDLNNFAPRFGFNWSPGSETGFVSKLTGGPGQTSVRGGFGVFYDRVFGNLFSNASGNPPFQQDFFTFTGDFVQNLDRPPTQTPSATVPDESFIFPVIFALPGNNQFQTKYANPYTMAWNFGFQRQFGNGLLLEADYVGNRAVGLLRVIDGQMTSVERVNTITGSHIAISPTNLTNNFLNGVLNYAFFQTATNLSVGMSSYNAGQFRVTKNLTNKRWGTGQIQGAYTWSHSIDDAADPLVGQSGERTFPRDSSGFAQNPGSTIGGFRAERGNSGFDVRHRFVMNFLYEVPLEFENGFANAVFGNWALTGIWQWQSGSPWTPFSSTDSAGTGLSQRADIALAGGPVGTYTRLAPNPVIDPRTQLGPTRDLFRNPCSGTISATGASCTNQFDGREGGVGRNTIVGPDYNKFDLALIKRVPLNRFREGMRLVLRADFYNLFNRVNFDKPSATNININSLTFGASTAAFSPRIVQFVGRFEF